MIAAVNINPGYLTQTRDLTRYKKILFYAKIDGVNWYDLSDYVLKVRTNNRIELLETPAIDTAVVTVRNEDNAFTPTQYNDIFDPSLGKLNGTIDNDYLNKVWEVKIEVEVDNGTTTTQVPIFYGWKPANAITERHKTADIELKDLLWITTQKKPTNPLLYANYTPDQIINDILINRIGLDVSYLDLQALTTPWEVFIADNTKTWWQILQEITKATGGKLTCTPDGKIAFRTRIENYADPAPAITITEDNIKNYNINTKRQFNQIKIQSQGYEIGTTPEYVIDHELQGDASIVKAGTQGTFELEYTSEYIKDPDTYVYISYYLNDTPIATDRQFSAGYDDGNIRLDELTAYPDKLILKITNLSSTVDYRITHIKFSAIPIKKKSELTVTKPNQTGQPDAELSLTSYYSSEALLSNVSDALYNETTKTIKFVLQLNEFYPELFAGNLISLQLAPKGISSGTFLINGVEHELEAQKFRTSISITEWGNVIFDIADKQVSKVTPSEVAQQPPEQTQLETIQQQVQDLQTQVQTVDDRTNYLDGLAPATPTGLALATINENGLSFITASWNANTEADLIGYELAWSYDGINWNYITTTDTSVQFEVLGNMTVYVKVQSYDAEGKKSGWSTVQSITSAKDTTPPAIPTGLTATGLFQTIMVKWNKNTETDFDHYVLEYDTSDTFPAPKQIVTSSNYATLKELTVNTIYYIRIKAVDKSGNESDWSITVSVSTVKIDNENYYDYAAIKDAIIHNGYIDSAWISELDAGLIKSGYIDANRIAAGSITADKLSILPAFSVPAGTIAYWTNSLVDEINSIVPEGLTTINLAPTITLTPENAPEGSIVGDLLAGNKIYAGKSIQVGNKVFIENTSSDKGLIRINSGSVNVVKIGESALDDGSDGIAIFNGKLQIKNVYGKFIISGNGMRQVYNIQANATIAPNSQYNYPIYIPANSDGTRSIANIEIVFGGYIPYTNRIEVYHNSNLIRTIYYDTALPSRFTISNVSDNDYIGFKAPSSNNSSSEVYALIFVDFMFY